MDTLLILGIVLFVGSANLLAIDHLTALLLNHGCLNKIGNKYQPKDFRRYGLLCLLAGVVASGAAGAALLFVLFN